MTSRAAFLERLPYPDLMKGRMRMLAMHDAIVAPDHRSFEFHPTWGPGNAQMGACKDGEGNFFFAWFSSKGAVIRGFDHDSVMSPFRHDPPRPWPGIFDGLPTSFRYVLEEPAFVQDEITFAFWAAGREGDWRAGPVKLAKGKDPDGAERLLACFQKRFEGWRKDYYDTPPSRALDVLWWDREPITREVVLALNPEADLRVVREEAKLLGWKTSGLGGKATAPLDKTKVPGKKVSARQAPSPAPVHVRSFGEAEFVVRCQATRVQMVIHGKTVVAEAEVDVYEEIFDFVKARLEQAKRGGA